jgi:hypothetical protein
MRSYLWVTEHLDSWLSLGLFQCIWNFSYHPRYQGQWTSLSSTCLIYQVFVRGYQLIPSPLWRYKRERKNKIKNLFMPTKCEKIPQSYSSSSQVRVANEIVFFWIWIMWWRMDMFDANHNNLCMLNVHVSGDSEF